MGETLYFNNFWTWSNNSTVYNGERTAKHIFLGSERIVTKLNSANHPTYSEESASTYYYHSDHLGSASVISDNDGREYERIEYTPYGEVWIDKASATYKTQYRFTGKERDEETGLYYFGERYLDPKYSRWISTDPALGDYIPQAPISDEARRNNSKLPGMGGVFNAVNLNLYHYAANNPIRYTDPDGRNIKGMIRGALKITLASLEMKSGMGMLAAAVAGKFFTVGLSTGASVALGTAGVITMVDGANRFGLAIADFVAETADTFGAKVIDGDLLPSTLGGAIGAVIDKSNNECFSDTGKIGPAQKTGEKINAGVSYITSTLDYANTVKTASSAGEAITNEILQQYNNYDTVKTLAE